MRNTMRSLLATAVVLGVAGLGAATAQATDHQADMLPDRGYLTVFDVDVHHPHAPAAYVKDSAWVFIDQSATNINMKQNVG
ncbi:hypothetical protein GL263_24530 [Streptomyces durbertensis]|uniref:Uncharacterized protein n=1 Tax=Streptomyces durbertensis TaxID=2448886 RepID=A0ABR6EMW6_9ACTN|nr:hypothetical protein [Streptomyces durbertensis]MBB1246693.1 hypothetical protein [Streptomyces durbertensis]